MPPAMPNQHQAGTVRPALFRPFAYKEQRPRPSVRPALFRPFAYKRPEKVRRRAEPSAQRAAGAFPAVRA